MPRTNSTHILASEISPELDNCVAVGGCVYVTPLCFQLVSIEEVNLDRGRGICIEVKERECYGLMDPQVPISSLI